MSKFAREARIRTNRKVRKGYAKKRKETLSETSRSLRLILMYYTTADWAETASGNMSRRSSIREVTRHPEFCETSRATCLLTNCLAGNRDIQSPASPEHTAIAFRPGWLRVRTRALPWH